MNTVTTTEINSVTEWVEIQQEQGWCWFAGDEKGLYLWNRYSDTRNSPNAMVLKAQQQGLNRSEVENKMKRCLMVIDGVRFAPEKPEIFDEYGSRFMNSFRSMRHIVSDMQNPDADMEFLEDADYNKDPNECPKKLLNSDVAPFRELIERLTANDEDHEWLMCWMAHMIQKPGERPSVHPLFRTEHGVGKNVLVEQVLDKVLAGHTATTSLREIGNVHSETVANNLVVFVDESKAKGLNVYLKLKSVLASKVAMINPKYVRPYQQAIYARFMFADNTEGRAFSIEQEDRRIYVMEYVVHEKDKAETQQFIQDFLGWWSGHYDTVFQYLDEYDISGWCPFTCPMTAAKRDYLDMCTDQAETLISGYQETTQRMTITQDSWNQYVGSLNYSLEEYERIKWQALLTNKELFFERKLQDAGFRPRRATKKVDGKQKKKNAWILTNNSSSGDYDLILRENEAARSDDSEEGYIETGVTVQLLNQNDLISPVTPVALRGEIEFCIQRMRFLGAIRNLTFVSNTVIAMSWGCHDFPLL